MFNGACHPWAYDYCLVIFNLIHMCIFLLYVNTSLECNRLISSKLLFVKCLISNMYMYIRPYLFISCINPNAFSFNRLLRLHVIRYRCFLFIWKKNTFWTWKDGVRFIWNFESRAKISSKRFVYVIFQPPRFEFTTKLIKTLLWNHFWICFLANHSELCQFNGYCRVMYICSNLPS